MTRTPQLLSAVASACLVAGCSTEGTSAVDAGFHYTQLSAGTATLSGAFTGTWEANGFAFLVEKGFLLLDGGTSGPYIYVQVSSAPTAPPPFFGCSFELFQSTTLDAGVYTPDNVSDLSCNVIVFPTDGGTESEFWGNLGGTLAPASIFQLQLTSPGPESVFSSGANWYDPTATLSMYLAPSPGQTQGVVVSVTVAPPTCPVGCAPGP
jgi:hypothetical protein